LKVKGYQVIKYIFDIFRLMSRSRSSSRSKVIKCIW